MFPTYFSTYCAPLEKIPETLNVFFFVIFSRYGCFIGESASRSPPDITLEVFLLPDIFYY